MQSGFRNGKSEGQQTTGHDELSVNEISREIPPASAGIMINVYGKEKEYIGRQAGQVKAKSGPDFPLPAQ
ncbi:MAG: hypothetical protein V8Q21_10915 [Akkermansia muciniphila]